MFLTYTVIPSQGRPCLYDCLAALKAQTAHTFVISNGGFEHRALPGVSFVAADTSELNISRWWNQGLDAVAAASDQAPHNVLLLNDDVILAPGSVARLNEALRRTGATLAFATAPHETAEQVFREPGPPRITGWCFMLRGEVGLRADETLRWWCGDNDLDWSARRLSGSVAVPGVERTHLFHNSYTKEHPDLVEQGARDYELFVAKWGRSPSSRSLDEVLAGACNPS